MRPAEDQLRPVLSIDLGASYTKLAWRPAWGWTDGSTEEDNCFASPSVPINLYPEQDFDGYMIPSLAYDPGDGTDWLFGKEAAGITPSQKGCLHSNWKSVLFDDRLEEDSLLVTSAAETASRFLRWLGTKIRDSRLPSNYALADANTRICIPALHHSSVGLRRLRKAFEQAEWNKNLLLEVTEPKANLLGFASSGRNHVNYLKTDINGPVVDWRALFGGDHTPIMAVMRKAMFHGSKPPRWCIIDIGSFTTDIAICEIGLPIKIELETSYCHGLTQIDKQLKEMLHKKGIQVSSACHDDFDTIKQQVYNRKTYTDIIQNREVRIDNNDLLEIDKWLADFANQILENSANHFKCLNGYLLTGGPANIPAINETIINYFKSKPVQELSKSFWKGANSSIDLNRQATALGGASVILDFDDSENAGIPTSLPITQSSGGHQCSCRGGNKDCARCGGSGFISIGSELRSRHPELLRTPKQSAITFFKQPRAASKEDSDLIHDNPPSKPFYSQRLFVDPIINDIKPVSIHDLIDSWNRSKEVALQEHSLDGWMGELVFGKSAASRSDKQLFLATPQSQQGRAAWLRLLCLGCCLSARIQRTTLKRFWTVELPDVWEVLIPQSDDQTNASSYNEKLDSFFIKAIHKQFKNRNASDEDSELWRRVFYDFRKMHEFVYRNDLAGAFLDLLKTPTLGWSSIAHFLKSGLLPDGSTPWRGVLGQSMTSPILFILRELRRLGIVDARFNPSCFYVNSYARKVACGLDWITRREVMVSDFDGLVELSQKCHRNMLKECPDLLPWFDLPLQNYK